MSFGATISNLLLSGLGLVASGERAIKPGTQYDHFFNGAKGNEIELMAEGTVYDTLKHMAKIVGSTKEQTAKISKKLKGKTTEETARNLWNFLFHNVQYKKDNPLREQLRTPSRTWRDRKTGVDCDCYSIFISSVLSNLGIPHAFRMAGYDGDFQHVYVVVPKDGRTYGARSTYYVIDPVVNKFDHETEFSKKHDHTMSRTTMLNGIGEDATTTSKCKPNNVQGELVQYIDVEQVAEMGYVVTQNFLEQFNFNYHQTGDNYGEFIIATPGGEIKVPSIITKEQAEKIKNLMGTTGEQAKDMYNDLKSKINPWWFVAIGILALVVFSPGRSRTNVNVNGLAGVQKKSKPKRRPSRGRLATLNI